MSVKKIFNRLTHSLAVFVLGGILMLPTPSPALEGADVAVYNDTAFEGGGAWSQGLTAIKSMLDQYGYSHEDITPTDLNNITDLNSLYSVIIFGGGWAGGYNTYINESGFANLRSFIANGGGFFGICAGAYFASDVVSWKEDFDTTAAVYDYSSDLFPGLAKGAVLGIIGWNDPTGCSADITEGAAMTTVSIATDTLYQDASELDILYYGGPAFYPFSVAAGHIQVVARYDLPGDPMDGAAAMVIFTYGDGKIFLTGPHPEISFSGCVLYYDDTNWGLMDVVLQDLMTP